MKVNRVCERVGMTRQNYYARRSLRSRRAVDVGLLLQLVRAERQYQPRLGVRKLYYLIKLELEKAGVKLGRDRVFEELGKAGLLVEPKRSEWPKTTHYDANLPVFSNLIKNYELTGPNQVWVSDITYIRTEERFLYWGLITDKWSRKIVGHNLGESLEVGNNLKALAMALGGLDRGEKPIHHSDRGCQYASHRYVEAVEAAGLRMSMTEKNHSAENSLAERVNGILKQEYWMDRTFASLAEAGRAARQAVRTYNERRPHYALEFQTPAKVHTRGR